MTESIQLYQLQSDSLKFLFRLNFFVTLSTSFKSCMTNKITAAALQCLFFKNKTILKDITFINNSRHANLDLLNNARLELNGLLSEFIITICLFSKHSFARSVSWFNFFDHERRIPMILIPISISSFQKILRYRIYEFWLWLFISTVFYKLIKTW